MAEAGPALWGTIPAHSKRPSTTLKFLPPPARGSLCHLGVGGVAPTSPSLCLRPEALLGRPADPGWRERFWAFPRPRESRGPGVPGAGAVEAACARWSLRWRPEGAGALRAREVLAEQGFPPGRFWAAPLFFLLATRGSRGVPEPSFTLGLPGVVGKLEAVARPRGPAIGAPRGSGKDTLRQRGGGPTRK